MISRYLCTENEKTLLREVLKDLNKCTDVKWLWAGRLNVVKNIDI